jgi:hypothetical protein
MNLKKLDLRSTISGDIDNKGHPNRTLFIEYNTLTLKSTILMVEINVKSKKSNNFFFKPETEK